MRRLLRGFRVLSLVAVAAFLPSAHAAWGDVSYDPNPATIDEDQAALFDAFGLLTHVVSLSRGGTSARQDFESGFVDAQVLTDWAKLGDNRVRFGFATAQQIDRRSRIGQIDPAPQPSGSSTRTAPTAMRRTWPATRPLQRRHLSTEGRWQTRPGRLVSAATGSQAWC
ncbi:MAG: hypothetical protein IPJ27_21235 [Candidatus Accumulibacter sp.]|uniref:Uncharacterized protein n=1 Tax=Candidatus Accumulibacter proximus TaxID=2954385 RepID=A0A935Q117_9PROT|nr:hypothetical protein [Candidatus Accumulibacter proximus]